MPPKKPPTPKGGTVEQEPDPLAYLDEFYRKPLVPLMLVARNVNTMQTHASGLSGICRGVTEEKTLFAAATDSRVVMLDSKQFRPRGEFGGPSDFVFGGEEEWQGPRVHRAMLGPVSAILAHKRYLGEDPPLPVQSPKPAAPPPEEPPPAGGKPKTPPGKKPKTPPPPEPAAEKPAEPAFNEVVVTGTTQGVLQVWELWAPPPAPPEPKEEEAPPEPPPDPKAKPKTPPGGKKGAPPPEPEPEAPEGPPPEWTCTTTLQVGSEASKPSITALLDYQYKLFVGSKDHTIRVYNPRTWEVVATMEQPEAVTTLFIHTTSAGYDDMLLSGCTDRKIRIWDLKTYELKYTLEGHTDAVTCFASFPDGRLLSGGADGRVRMWKIYDRKVPVVPHQWHHDFDFADEDTSGVRSLQVLGSKQVVAGCSNGAIKVWYWESDKSPPQWTCRRKITDHVGSVACMLPVRDILITGGADRKLRVYR